MSQRKILLPFGLPPTEQAKPLIQSLALPAFAALLARAKLIEASESDAFAKALPHENWLFAQAGGVPSAETSPALAHFQMQTLGMAAHEGRWFIINPMHLHIARDHLIATDLRALALNEAHARALFALAQACAEETGLTLLYANPTCWFLRADAWQDLRTATPDAACGHNIGLWMPQGNQARAWRKLQNEIQMSWHEHPVNQAREQQGLPTINSLWIWGGSDALRLNTTPDILVCPQLTESALNSRWHEWREALCALEETLFAPQLRALLSGEITLMHLILTHSTKRMTYLCTRTQQRKFWCKANLNRLLP